MIYPKTYEEKIEFTKVRNQLKGLCLSTLGQQRVDEMYFSSEHALIVRMLNETSEFVHILRVGDFPDQNFYDARQQLKRIRIENTFFDVTELIELRRSMETIDRVVTYFRRKDDGEQPLYPTLLKLTTDIDTFPGHIRAIDRILDETGEIKDTASAELSRIRKEKRSAAARISRLLTNILNSAQSEGYVEKKATPTLRDGRLVIPVAPAMKRKISGIVHDESDSGRTLYIEPTEVVEANNHVHELENEERREIIRILREVSAIIRPDADAILNSYEFLADVDFIRAKAKFAEMTRAVNPHVRNGQLIDWSMAVHPLLRMSLEKKGAAVVPLDINLHGPRQRILLISGPNAGGKSVCLKTVGLLQYMLQCGMMVPMAESSVCGIFKSLFIDIGDEQSIEDELSTYSSHLSNMKEMLKHADGASLLLVDEFGGGTEPQIGGAIAEALLKRFNHKHAFGVITTHYQNLKQLAQDCEGIVNGAMLYDRQQMQPLFQLRIGNAGSSFAVEIARKIGIPEDVIREASDIVGSDYINSDKYLQDIVRDKRYWENKRQTTHQHEKRMEETIARYEADIRRLQEEKQAIMAKAKEEALNLIADSNARIEQTIREIKEAQAERERTRQARQDLAAFKQEVHGVDPAMMEEQIRRKMEKLKARQERRANRKNQEGKNAGKVPTPQATSPADEASTQQPAAIAEGTHVRIKGQTVVGKVIKVNGNEALVAFGSIQSNVKLNRLEVAEAPREEKRAITFVSRQTQDNIRETSLNFRSDIDVRGMRADEALQAVTYFVDDALVASASRLRILHGTGGGVLKTLIRQYLSTLPAVADYYDENPQFGGAGITIVELV